MKKIIIVFMFIIILCGCKSYNTPIKTIENTSDRVVQVTIDIIFDEIKYAYTEATYDRLGNYPTLNQVREKFSLDSVIWEGDKIKSDLGFECSVNVENNELKVSCLDRQLDYDLVLGDV